MELLRSLPASSIETVTEPSGTYGDPLCCGLVNAGLPLFHVTPQRSQKYAEVYDGVPSQHDGKSAILLARLHFEGFSMPHCQRSVEQRDLAAAVSELDYLQDAFVRTKNRLEAQLARHWPELGSVIALDRVSVLKMLATYGDPRVVAESSTQVAQELKKAGGIWLEDQKVRRVLESGRTTIGVPMTAGEQRLMQELAQEILRIRGLVKGLEKRLKVLSRDEPAVQALRPLIGLLTAVTLVIKGGDPRQCPHPAAYVKRLGLNLKIRSSGRYVGQLRISKRGSGAARRWLYLFVLRLIQKNAVVRAWYHRKVARDAGLKMKALVAVMRKVAKALWHVARGESFDASRLFDIRRLAVAAR
jgi:transposase